MTAVVHSHTLSNVMLPMPANVIKLARRFRTAGYELYVVGGAVRDALRGRPVSDYDFATSARPEEVRSLFRRVIPTGLKHGTVTIVEHGEHFEVTTYRSDGDYSDHRRPDTVQFTRSLDQDLARRDFTINAIAYDPVDREIVDPYDGRGDIAAQVVRSVGSAATRFDEDALRMLRAVRFACVFVYRMDEPVVSAIEASAATITAVSAERIRDELNKMMRAAQPSRGWEMLYTTGLLAYILPELERCHPDHSPVDVFGHLLATVDCAANDEVSRWAALLHDIAKPETYQSNAGTVHFPGHDERSAEYATEILVRLRFSNEMVKRISQLVRHHMIGYSATWSDAAVRRFIARVGRDAIDDQLRLARADRCAYGARTAPALDELEDRLTAILRSNAPLTMSDLAIDGRDVMTELQLKPGPVVGIVLRELYETVLDNPEQNERGTLLAIAKEFVRQRLSYDSDNES